MPNTSKMPAKHWERERARQGGKARAAKLTSDERRTIARTAARARWGPAEQRTPPPMNLPVCGETHFQDMGGWLRVWLNNTLQIGWDVWDEADVTRVITLLRQWRTKQRRWQRRQSTRRTQA